MFRKKRRTLLGLSWVIAITMATGCWNTKPAPTPIAPAAAPRVKDPVLPEVTAAEFGTWDRDGFFHQTYDVPLFAGSVFGWRLSYDCTPLVTIDEELTLPAPGDWPDDPVLEVSADKKHVELREQLECVTPWVEKKWSVSPGDPPGVWTIKVTPMGYASKTFRATFSPDIVVPPPGP